VAGTLNPAAPFSMAAALVMGLDVAKPDGSIGVDPWIDQTVGTVATPANCVTCVPFMNQIAISPLVSCHRISLLPSPLKSPVSTIVQYGAERECFLLFEPHSFPSAQSAFAVASLDFPGAVWRSLSSTRTDGCEELAALLEFLRDSDRPPHPFPARPS
jgi:hypothetical protein